MSFWSRIRPTPTCVDGTYDHEPGEGTNDPVGWRCARCNHLIFPFLRDPEAEAAADAATRADNDYGASGDYGASDEGTQDTQPRDPD